MAENENCNTKFSKQWPSKPSRGKIDTRMPYIFKHRMIWSGRVEDFCLRPQFSKFGELKKRKWPFEEIEDPLVLVLVFIYYMCASVYTLYIWYYVAVNHTENENHIIHSLLSSCWITFSVCHLYKISFVFPYALRSCLDKIRVNVIFRITWFSVPHRITW